MMKHVSGGPRRCCCGGFRRKIQNLYSQKECYYGRLFENRQLRNGVAALFNHRGDRASTGDPLYVHGTQDRTQGKHLSGRRQYLVSHRPDLGDRPRDGRLHRHGRADGGHRRPDGVDQALYHRRRRNLRRPPTALRPPAWSSAGPDTGSPRCPFRGSRWP